MLNMKFRDTFKFSVYTVCALYILSAIQVHAKDAQEWNGKWFPQRPDQSRPILDPNIVDEDMTSGNMIRTNRIKTMGISDPDCDDAETNLVVDYDPKNISHHVRYICLENRSMFHPNASTEPYLREYDIPSEYSALHRCMNESIEYDYNIPTFGSHRPLWLQYGEYDYAPPQRWVHNLEHGAIVAIYHPCANKRQLADFRKLIKQCLHRHVITPYEKLTPERPFALVAWGKSLEMSYVDAEIAVAFIRMAALKAPERISKNGQYNAGIIDTAKTVSIDDQNLCPSM